MVDVRDVGGQSRLERDAITVEMHPLPIRASSLDDIIRAKQAASHPKDRADLDTLRSLRERVEPYQAGWRMVDDPNRTSGAA